LAISGRWPITGGILGVCLMASPAFARTSAPLLAPLHDVTIDYSLEPPNHTPIDVVVQAQAGGQKLRVHGENLPVELVIDRAAQVAHIMLPIAAAYANVSIAGQDPQRGVLQHAVFTRHGARRVAGLGCTDWSAIWANGHANACITADGVILEANLISEHHGTTRIVAHRVTEGPISRENFVVPANYTNTGAFPIPAFDPGQ